MNAGKHGFLKVSRFSHSDTDFTDTTDKNLNIREIRVRSRPDQKARLGKMANRETLEFTLVADESN